MHIQVFTLYELTMSKTNSLPFDNHLCSLFNNLRQEILQNSKIGKSDKWHREVFTFVN